MTKARRAGAERWYDDACGTAHALEIIGERWSLLVARELMFGPRRFSELRAGLPGISANVLSQRLESLEAAHVLRRRQLPSPVNAHVYELTPWGYDLAPVLRTLGHWAARSPSHDPTLPLSAVSIMMSMQTMLDVARGARLAGRRAGFAFGADQFVATLGEGELHIERGDAEQAEFVYRGSPELLAALLYGGLSLAEVEASGQARVQGDRALAKRYLALFRLPPKIT